MKKLYSYFNEMCKLHSVPNLKRKKTNVKQNKEKKLTNKP